MHFRSSGCLLFAALAVAPVALPAETTPAHKANYDLAMKWTSAKIAKRMFDTSVAPHWLENGDRFWYAYETSQGRKYWLVDCRAKTKKPLFDGVRMAAMLTRITLSPYDAQHLPIRTVKFIKKDSALLFELDLSKNATVRVGDQFKTVQEISDDAVKSDDMQEKGKEKQTDKLIDKQQGKTDTKTDVKTDKGTDQKTDEGKSVKTDTQTTTGTGKTTTQTVGKVQAAGGAEPASATKTLYFEYDLKTDQLTLVPTYKAPRRKCCGRASRRTKRPLCSHAATISS